MEKIQDRIDIKTRTLLRKIKDIEREINPRDCVSAFRNGYGSMPNSIIYDAINEIKKSDIKNKGFLDMGSGLGGKVIIANSLGLPAYGVEINGFLHYYSERVLERTQKFLSDEDCKILSGSYFPNEYIKMRESGKSLALDFEKDELLCRDEFIPVGNSRDIYEHNGIDLGKIGIFYRYGWGKDVPSTLEMFSLFSSDDAILISASSHYPDKFKELLKELKLKVHGDYTGLFYLISKDK
ncbi:MAG: hypothetical protein ACOCUU_02790 [Nanoarchaeota archaeon]